jgi:hypothetical protein
MKFVLVCAVVGSFAAVLCSAAPMKQKNIGLFQCEKLSASFCDPQFGCQLDSQTETCYFDNALPRAVINCTQSLIDVRQEINNIIYISVYSENIIILSLGTYSLLVNQIKS